MRQRLTGTDRRWVIGGVVAAVLALIGLAGPWGPRMIDLDVYRVGGDALRHGTDLYAVADPEAGLVFTYPVFAAVTFIPFSLLPWALARVLLTALSLAALFVIVALVVRQLRAAGSTIAWSVSLSVAAIALHPIWETLTFGQVNLILTALVLVDVLIPGRRPWRGVLVGVAAGIKLVPGIFVLYFLVAGQRRAAVTAALTTLGTVLVGFAVQPGPAWAFWTDYALSPRRTGEVAYVTNQSFTGVAARLLRDPTPPRMLTLTLAAAVVVVALVLARRYARAGDTLTAVSVVGVASLLASPVSWSHHWVWAIPCLGTLAAWAAGGTRRWWIFGAVTALVATGPMQFLPKAQLRELGYTHPQQMLASVYAVLAAAYLVWAAVRSGSPAAYRITPARWARNSGSA